MTTQRMETSIIDASHKVVEIFYALYQSESIKFKSQKSFKEIMQNNETRLEYLNNLLFMAQKNKLSEECKIILDDNIDFLEKFMNNEFSCQFTVSKKYYDDKEENLIIPTMEDLEYLFSLINKNIFMYNLLYSNNQIMLELPRNTFNQRMYRALEVKYHNLAHLLGLTESEPIPDNSKNLLKKHYIANFAHNSNEPMSVQLLDWIISDAGKNELRRLHQITLDFVADDKKKNPNSYDEEGNIKSKSLESFKKRFKDKTCLDYPIIKFSRYIIKCINNLNFLNLNNTIQMILDYNAPPGKKDEKDIFIVNTDYAEMSCDVNIYLEQNREIHQLLHLYALSTENEEELSLKLEEKGVDITDKTIQEYLNLLKAHQFVGAHRIMAREVSSFEEKISKKLSEEFKRNIHIVGFQTEHHGRITTPYELSAAYAHCDTSISLTVPELVGEYYERGRPFFIDKCFDLYSCQVLRISNPMEEIAFNKMIKKIEKTKNKIEQGDFSKTDPDDDFDFGGSGFKLDISPPSSGGGQSSIELFERSEYSSTTKTHGDDELQQLMETFKERFITYKAIKNLKL